MHRVVSRGRVDRLRNRIVETVYGRFPISRLFDKVVQVGLHVRNRQVRVKTLQVEMFHGVYACQVQHIHGVVVKRIRFKTLDQLADQFTLTKYDQRIAAPWQL